MRHWRCRKGLCMKLVVLLAGALQGTKGKRAHEPTLLRSVAGVRERATRRSYRYSSATPRSAGAVILRP